MEVSTKRVYAGMADLHCEPFFFLTLAEVSSSMWLRSFNVKPGAYLLEVLARDHVFDQVCMHTRRSGCFHLV